ncbi:predicted protein [Botrytis cinerea T4]|uniref:Uncharacterized protein n=1 Tax=Botryotinia fuckeliana (strain T4) TaxID=999810 RepID=G2YTT9_BOTF4|nr:predicted protein [Botrytis cinerea T4]
MPQSPIRDSNNLQEDSKIGRERGALQMTIPPSRCTSKALNMTIVDLSCCGINIGTQGATRAKRSNHI